ncbi:MAG TPA: PQQ-binding-like beta-propeller repeat protein, partial [Gemmatales bacterium]|nr:PQQ-binding-like beta-propeller repeat protein [Gemmatales bacterium]
MLYLLTWFLLIMEGEVWPEFRGPNGHGLAAAHANPPVEWSEQNNLLWKTAIHDMGWSSPVVRDGKVWLTTAPRDGKKLYALCVELATGKILHDVAVFEVGQPEFCHDTNTYASCTPVLESGRVYVHFGSYGTACLDTVTGKKLWERRDFPCDHFRGPGSSPILVDDFLILSFDGVDVQYLVALNKMNGSTVWQTRRSTDYQTDNGDNKKAYSTPGLFTIAGVRQMISPGAVTTFAYNPVTGEELWSVRHGGMNASARVLHGHGLFYLTTGDGPTHLVAVAEHGQKHRQPAWTISKAIPKRSSPIL